MSTLLAEKKRFQSSLAVPFAFICVLWAIKIIEFAAGLNLGFLGVYPRSIIGLRGILTYPLIHGDFYHLISNSWPILMMGFILVHSYRKVAATTFLTIYFLSGILVWLFARGSYHIGASGLVYGLAFFIFFSGVFRKDVKSIALACLVVFLYGGIVWGLLPIQPGVSFEGHIAGAIAGLMCAYFFRGVDRVEPHVWNEVEEDPDNVEEEPFWVRAKKELEEVVEQVTDNSTTDEPDQEETEKPKRSIEIPIKDTDSINDWEVKYNYLRKDKNDTDA